MYAVPNALKLNSNLVFTVYTLTRAVFVVVVHQKSVRYDSTLERLERYSLNYSVARSG